MSGDEPGFVVASGKLDERGSQLFDGVECSHPQQVCLQGSDESLCYAVALGLAYEGGRCFDPQAFDFVLEIAGHVVGAMIVTQLQSTRHTGRLSAGKVAKCSRSMARVASSRRMIIGELSMKSKRTDRTVHEVYEGIFYDLARSFLDSEKFAGYAEGTQDLWRRELMFAMSPRGLGHVSLADIRPSLIQGYLDAWDDKPGKQANALRALRALERWAVVRDLLQRPMTLGIGRGYLPGWRASGNFHHWITERRHTASRRKGNTGHKVYEGSFYDLCQRFLESEKFASLSPGSQDLWRRELEFARAPLCLGAVSLADLRPALIQQYLDGWHDKPGKQANALRALRALEKWAVVRDLLQRPMTLGIGIGYSRGGSHSLDRRPR